MINIDVLITEPASQKQLKYAESLMNELGYDPDDYDLYDGEWTKQAISGLIDELKSELF